MFLKNRITPQEFASMTKAMSLRSINTTFVLIWRGPCLIILTAFFCNQSVYMHAITFENLENFRSWAFHALCNFLLTSIPVSVQLTHAAMTNFFHIALYSDENRNVFVLFFFVACIHTSRT